MNVIRELIVSLGFNTDTKPLDALENRIIGMPSRIAPAIANIRNMVAGAFAGIGIFELGKSFIQAGDEFLSMQAKIASGLNESAGRTAEFMERIYGLSRQTGTAMDAGATAFARFAGAARQSGRSYEEAFSLVETLQKSFILNGTSQSEAASVTLQVGQALSKGVFNDDEFKSFMENAGPLAEEFAKALGKTVPELRAMSTAGKLTTDIVFPALIRAGERFRVMFDTMPMNASRAWGILAVTFKRFLADVNVGIGASLFLGRAITYVSDQFEYLRLALPVIGQFITEVLGLQNVFETLGIAISIVLAPLAARIAMALLPLIAGAAVVGLLALTIQDLWGWSQGKDSLFGRLLDNFNPEAIEGFKQAWVDIAYYINLAWEGLKSFAEVLRSGLETLVRLIFGEGASNVKSLNDNLKTTEGYLLGIVSALGAVRLGMIALGWLTAGGTAAAVPAAAAAAGVPSAIAGAQAAMNATGGGMGGSGLGIGLLFDVFKRTGQGGDLAGGFRIPSVDRTLGSVPHIEGLNPVMDWLARNGGLPNMPTGNILPSPGNVTNAPTINQEINVTAPGGDGASLGSTVGTAARSAAENAVRLGDSMARDLLRGNPATEAGAR